MKIENYMKLYDEIYINGIEVSYFFVCKRKLWLFSKQIYMEQNSDFVLEGKILHENSYKNKRKEILIEDIKIDIYEKNRKIISEIKKSKAIEIAHIMQMKYYIWRLKKIGINVEGEILYPMLRKKLKIKLTKDDEQYILKIIKQIEKIKKSNKIPDKLYNKVCKKCSYYELCYA